MRERMVKSVYSSNQTKIETPSLKLPEIEPADKKKFLVGKKNC